MRFFELEPARHRRRIPNVSTGHTDVCSLHELCAHTHEQAQPKATTGATVSRRRTAGAISRRRFQARSRGDYREAWCSKEERPAGRIRHWETDSNRPRRVGRSTGVVARSPG